MGIGSGSAISFSPIMRIAAIYILILFLPMFFHFLLMGTTVGYALAIPMVLYYYILLSLSGNVGQSLAASYEQEEKDKIIQVALTQKQDELNTLFKKAPVGVFY